MRIGGSEVRVVTEGWRLEKGLPYLFDTDKGDDGAFYPKICGSTGEIGDQDTADFVSYLRQRAKKQAATSLTVQVLDNFRPTPGTDVFIEGPQGNPGSKLTPMAELSLPEFDPVNTLSLFEKIIIIPPQNTKPSLYK